MYRLADVIEGVRAIELALASLDISNVTQANFGEAGEARTHDRRIMRTTAALPTLYLHGYDGAVPPMALIAHYARVDRSTSRSTTTTASA
jgi:uncharacterized alpha/beta hydrolase family protein